MLTLETLESIQAYADRLHRDAATSRHLPARSRPRMRSLLRNAGKGRRAA
jgi:hypothetical protein